MKRSAVFLALVFMVLSVATTAMAEHGSKLPWGVQPTEHGSKLPWGVQPSEHGSKLPWGVQPSEHGSKLPF